MIAWREELGRLATRVQTDEVVRERMLVCQAALTEQLSSGERAALETEFAYAVLVDMHERSVAEIRTANDLLVRSLVLNSDITPELVTLRLRLRAQGEFLLESLCLRGPDGGESCRNELAFLADTMSGDAVSWVLRLAEVRVGQAGRFAVWRRENQAPVASQAALGELEWLVRETDIAVPAGYKVGYRLAQCRSLLEFAACLSTGALSASDLRVALSRAFESLSIAARNFQGGSQHLVSPDELAICLVELFARASALLDRHSVEWKDWQKTWPTGVTWDAQAARSQAHHIVDTWRDFAKLFLGDRLAAIDSELMNGEAIALALRKSTEAPAESDVCWLVGLSQVSA